MKNTTENDHKETVTTCPDTDELQVTKLPPIGGFHGIDDCQFDDRLMGGFHD